MFGVVGITTPMAAFVDDSVAAAATAALVVFCCPSAAAASCIYVRLGIGRTGQHDRVFSGNEKLSANKKNEQKTHKQSQVNSRDNIYEEFFSQYSGHSYLPNSKHVFSPPGVRLLLSRFEAR